MLPAQQLIAAKGVPLPRTFEPGITSAGPRNHVSLGIANGDDGVVKSRTNMSYTDRYILSFSTAWPLTSTSWSCHVALLLSIQPIFSYLQRAWTLTLVGLSALSANRKSSAVTQAA